MRRVVRHDQEIRLVSAAVRLDVAHGLVGDDIGLVVVDLDARTLPAETLRAHIAVALAFDLDGLVAVAQVEDVVAAAREAEVVVETADQRARLPLAVLEMPLADETRTVARRLHAFGDGALRCGERHLHDVRRAAGVEIVAEARLIPPGVQRRAGGTADGRRDIGLAEAHTLRGEPVDVGGLEITVAQIAHVTDTEVVGDEEDDVRPLCRAAPRHRRRGGDDDGDDRQDRGQQARP